MYTLPNFSPMTKETLTEFLALKKKLFGPALFVVLDHKDPQVIRYNELAIQYFKMLNKAVR